MCNEALSRFLEDAVEGNAEAENPPQVWLVDLTFLGQLLDGYLTANGDFGGEVISINDLEACGVELKGGNRQTLSTTMASSISHCS